MESPEAAAPPAEPALPPRCWSVKYDAAKVYFHRCGTATPPLHKKLKAWLWDTELPVVAIYRFGQLCMVLREKSPLLGLPPFAVFVVLQFFLRLILHVEINHRCRIGPGLHLGHPYTILIGPTVLGANCSVTHNVTIGMGLGATGRGVPTLGDDVWIGPCSTVTGPIRVGDGAVIAAGSVVSKDVPPRGLVVGNPARVVNPDYDSAPLIGYRLPDEARRPR